MQDFAGRRTRLALLTLLLLPLLHIDIVPLRCTEVDLSRTPDLDAARSEHHLAPVCQPADDARDGEQNGEEVKREAYIRVKR